MTVGGKKKPHLQTRLLTLYGGLSSGQPQPKFLTFKLIDIVAFKTRESCIDSAFLTDLYVKKGYSTNRISKELGCSRFLVRKKLEEAGVTDFEYVVTPDKRIIEKIKRLREKGDSYQRIAEKFNLWRVKTRSGDGKWYAKTARDVFIRSNTTFY